MSDILTALGNVFTIGNLAGLIFGTGAGILNEFEMRKEAINCKEKLLSNMIVYYIDNNCPTIKMISIDKSKLEEARRREKMD